MARRIKDVTKDYLESVPLPVHGSTYTVISHKSIIDYAYQELANQGYVIVNEEYRCTHDGQIAQGIYKLQYGNDPEMAVMFAWTNSYNKKIRFKCGVGGYIVVNNTVMLSTNMGAYSRKHTGTADADTIATMQSQIANAAMYYVQLVQDKEEMKTIELSRKRQAELLGVLFADHQILNTEQASLVLQQMEKPSFFYNGGKDTLWAFYNHITFALQHAHPQTWMEDQRIMHMCLINELKNSMIIAPESMLTDTDTIIVFDPLDDNYGEPENQTNILTQIAELETEDIEIHIESDQEYLERVAEIEGEPEVEVLELEDVLPQARIDTYVDQGFIDAQVTGGKAPEVIDLDDEEDEDWEKLEAAGIITPCIAHDVETEKEEETIVQYTDPAGNAFEVPLIKPETTPEKVKFVIDEPEVVELPTFQLEEPTLVMTPEEMHEHEDEINEIMDNEIQIPSIVVQSIPEPSSDLDFNLDFEEDTNETGHESSHDFFF